MTQPKTPIERARRLRRDLTAAERKLWRALRAHGLAGLHFHRQAPCGPFIADFLRHEAKLVTEVDGATHSTDDEIARDASRDAWFAANGFRVWRFTNAEVFENLEGVLATILSKVEMQEEPPPLPSPAARERE